MKSIILVALLGLVSSSVIEQPKGPRDNGVIIDDMILTQEQYEIMYGKGLRSGIPFPNYRWPNKRLPYKIDDSISSYGKRKIKKAIARFNAEMSGCFKIVPRSSEKSYVRVYDGGDCSSDIGKNGRKEQDLSLSTGCYSAGTIVHEFIHAIGFHHEQSRYDRDDYVKIEWQNIINELEYNFQKVNKDWLTGGTEYDGKSIMHYKAYNGASSNGGPTITSKRPDLFTTNELGKSKWMTKNDRLEIRKMYKCDTNPGPGKICDGTHDYESYDRECCSREEPCGLNQGDCDKDYECKGNLVCGRNNCPPPFPDRADCCVNP